MSVDPNDYPWLCEVGVVDRGFVRLRVRFHAMAPSQCIHVSLLAFRARVSASFRIVERFWLNQFGQQTQLPCFTPVPVVIMSAASWTFGRDLSRSGAFFLRILLGDFFGRFQMKQLELADALALML